MSRVHVVKPGDTVVVSHPGKTWNPHDFEKAEDGFSSIRINVAYSVDDLDYATSAEPQHVTAHAHVNSSTPNDGELLKAINDVLRRYGLGSGWNGDYPR